jgi:hypothetical protein
LAARGASSEPFSVSAWSDVAHDFRGDGEMLWNEIVGGFVIAGCKASFDADPERYVDPAGREAQALAHAGHEQATD